MARGCGEQAGRGRARRRPGGHLFPQHRPQQDRETRELEYVCERYANGGYTFAQLEEQIARILGGGYANEPSPLELVADFLASPN